MEKAAEVGADVDAAIKETANEYLQAVYSSPGGDIVADGGRPAPRMNFQRLRRGPRSRRGVRRPSIGPGHSNG